MPCPLVMCSQIVINITQYLLSSLCHHHIPRHLSTSKHLEQRLSINSDIELTERHRARERGRVLSLLWPLWQTRGWQPLLSCVHQIWIIDRVDQYYRDMRGRQVKWDYYCPLSSIHVPLCYNLCAWEWVGVHWCSLWIELITKWHGQNID